MSAELPEELPPNFEFGGYVIHACIGRGGMARVYRAEQAALHRSVALKVLDRWLVDEPTGMERFLREARAAASIKHPNVVDIVDVGVWCDRPYIVMELLEGCDLESYLDQFGTLSDGEIARLALPVIAGVMAVHDAGVVHRDLKPSNIFLSNGPEGEVIPKVLDFGVSKFSNGLHDPIRRATKTREIIGTPAYMAPEALNGVRELGPAADQYALGAVLYECAVGRPPFEGETLLELLKEVAVGRAEPPSALRPDISPILERAILRAISSEPGARFEDLRDMGRALWPLADPRTQTIWQPSFGAGKSPGYLMREEAPRTLVPQRHSDDESTLKRELPLRGWSSTRRAWAWPLAGAAAVAAIFGLGQLVLDAPSATPAPAATTPTTAASGARADELPRTPTALAPTDGAAAGTPRDRSDSAEDEPTRRRSSARPPKPPETRRRALQPTRPTVAVRRRPDAVQTVQSSATNDTPGTLPQADTRAPTGELDGLFVPPRQESVVTAARADGELDGLFPQSGSVARGANDAPFPE